jgi:outer membrane biosynthesis protein TonB
MRVERFAWALLLAAGVAGCSQENKETPAPAAIAAPTPVPAPAPAAKEPAPAPAPTPAPTPVAAPAKPAPAPTPAPAPAAKVPEGDRPAALIVQLGDKEYAVREKAGEELAAMGKKVLPLLEEATRNPDAEISRRAAELIERIKGSEEEAGVPDIPGVTQNFKRGLAQNSLTPGMTMSAGDPKGQGAVTASMVVGGEVRLTVAPKGAEAKTFTAPSLREFEIKYPKLYAKYLDTSAVEAKPEPPRPPVAKPKPPPAPAKAPEAKPVDPELVAKLVKQLGDADAELQKKAAAELAKLGEPALPGLRKAAAGSDDAAKRAAELAFRIEDDAAPKIASLARTAKGMNKHGGHTPSTGGAVGNGHDGFTCGSEGNELAVDYSGDGSVAVKVKTKNGEERSYSAPSLDEFKKRYPGVFKAYLVDEPIKRP